MNAQELKKQVNTLLQTAEYDRIKSLLLAHKDTTEHDNDLAMVCYLCTIYEQEQAAGQRTIFEKTGSIEVLLERYTTLKFWLRRIDFDVSDDMGAFYQFLSQAQVSSYELLRVIDFSVVHKDKVLQRIGAGTAEGFAADMERDTDTSTIGRNDNRTEDEDVSGQDCGSLAANIGGAQQFCFIICTNDAIYAEECIHYIRHLIVPEGMEVDILTVEGAKSLASAYNEAMQSSQAKYKVYLHHDTFIINPYFIRDCLEIFRMDERIGMLGNVGVNTMPSSGVMWDADRFGMLYEQHIYETELLANAIDNDVPYLEAEAIDGFIMVTQYDVPWREDLFDKWDFYDCSQSMEFIRRGYRVVVPNMKAPWCVHDCGFINLQNYDIEKEKFITEYLRDGR